MPALISTKVDVPLELQRKHNNQTLVGAMMISACMCSKLACSISHAPIVCDMHAALHVQQTSHISVVTYTQ